MNKIRRVDRVYLPLLGLDVERMYTDSFKTVDLDCPVCGHKLRYTATALIDEHGEMILRELQVRVDEYFKEIRDALISNFGEDIVHAKLIKDLKQLQSKYERKHLTLVK